ncbi:alpha/beta hydrolase family protein [Desulfonema magnum]|uniref:Peptidase S9 family protein domain-containing protein n=1 Tax=Desulfonema magnum TaxID=45655 RepID=A0A975GRG7_9BACT|nr:prolyl oligopeptidase family serine peptidase [Desulfonema magnum]QTA90900.1 Peptidase S9 family protein domain-containing protein [Desulfonema magnum]
MKYIAVIILTSLLSFYSYAGMLDDRAKFSAELIANSYKADGPVRKVNRKGVRTIKYTSGNNKLSAYLYIPPETDKKKLPAIVWAHGGFGGIGPSLFEEQSPSNDQSVMQFVDAGMVVMTPSWRGENDNPGKFELFYGEVNDLLSAAGYLKTIDIVDQSRIYLGGHSTGGTLALLVAVAPNNLRAIFSFGGAPDILSVVSNGEGYGNTPFNYKNKKESYLRSAINYVSDIKTKTFYFEGLSSYAGYALKMNELASNYGVPFKAYIFPNGDHFNILYPLKRLIVKKIEEDKGEKTNISFDFNN